MPNSTKMLGDGMPKPARFVRDLSEPEDFHNFWLIAETDTKSADVFPAEKFIYRPTLADWRAIILSAATTMKNSRAWFGVTTFLIGCLLGLILGYTAKP